MRREGGLAATATDDDVEDDVAAVPGRIDRGLTERELVILGLVERANAAALAAATAGAPADKPALSVVAVADDALVLADAAVGLEVGRDMRGLGALGNPAADGLPLALARPSPPLPVAALPADARVRRGLGARALAAAAELPPPPPPVTWLLLAVREERARGLTER